MSFLQQQLYITADGEKAFYMSVSDTTLGGMLYPSWDQNDYTFDLEELKELLELARG